MNSLPRKQPTSYTPPRTLPHEAVEELRLKLRRDEAEEAYRQDRASYRDVEMAANAITWELRSRWQREYDEEVF